MKVFFIFLFISSAYASSIHEYVPASTVVKEAQVTTGTSSQSRAQDNQGNYAFAYKEDHSDGGSFRKEEGTNDGRVIGSYGLRTIDGRVRIVNYIADDLNGFRASIATNEPGIAAQAPAATSISTPHANIHNEPIPIHNKPIPIHNEPIPIYNEPIPIHKSSPVVEAPATLIKSYASSIYGPSLITDNILFGAVKPAIANKIASYIPPLNSPVNYGVPAALQTNDGLGYYEPTHVYSNPSGTGFVFGTNIDNFGYELRYRKKKK